MPLPNAREGDAIPFHTYPRAGLEGTIGSIEHAVWASLNHLCSRDVAQNLLYGIYGVRGKRALGSGANSLSLYIKQAFEFYGAASTAHANTAPLFYYYSFLNLAKAICELHNPRFHRRRESYSHGISWRPNPLVLSDPNTDYVTIVRRGVWQVLWESVLRQPCTAPDGTRLSIRQLLSYCPETSVEYSRTFGREQRRILLEEPNLVISEETRSVWLRFNVERDELTGSGLSGPRFLAMVRDWGIPLREVKCEEKDSRCFEQQNPRRLGKKRHYPEIVQADVRLLTLVSHPSFDDSVEYSIPIVHLPLRMPHLVATYTLMYWLGSLVRYDPHSLSALQDSKYWILIDGMMSQSRMWLLELFEWEIFQCETNLRSVR